MHLPTVSPELAREVRSRGSIEQKEFAKLILHWFPAMWTLLWTLSRRKAHTSQESRRQHDETMSARIIKALMHRDSFSESREINVDDHALKTKRVFLPDMVGDKGVSEVIAVMASDAMKLCAEDVHHVRLILEPNHVLVVIPYGISPVLSMEARLEQIQADFPLAAVRIEQFIASMHHGDAPVIIDVSQDAQIVAQLMHCLAIDRYRSCLEKTFRVHLAFQWPGVLISAPFELESRMHLFRSYAQQILTIAEHQVRS